MSPRAPNSGQLDPKNELSRIFEIHRSKRQGPTLPSHGQSLTHEYPRMGDETHQWPQTNICKLSIIGQSWAFGPKTTQLWALRPTATHSWAFWPIDTQCWANSDPLLPNHGQKWTHDYPVMGKNGPRDTHIWAERPIEGQKNRVREKIGGRKK